MIRSATPPPPYWSIFDAYLPGARASVIHVWHQMEAGDDGVTRPVVVSDYWYLYGGVPGGIQEGTLLCLVERTRSVGTHVAVLFPKEGYSARVGRPYMWSRDWIAYPLHPEGALGLLLPSCTPGCACANDQAWLLG